MDLFIARNVTPEDREALLMALKQCGFDEQVVKRPMTDAERAKKYRDSKKNRDTVVTTRDEIVTVCDGNTKEEREEKEEALPPSSPSSLSPLTPYPITPYNPPLPEEKEEREETNTFGVGATNRGGELLPFGEFVKLSQREYDNLCKDFGQSKADDMIRRMNSYIGEDKKLIRKYESRNHNLTLRNWERRNRQEAEAKQPKQKPKDKSFHDIAVERGLVEPSDFVEGFWR